MIRKALLMSAVLLCACSGAPAQDNPPPTPDGEDALNVAADTPQDWVEISAVVIGSDGSEIGVVSGTDGPHGFLLEVTIEPGGLTPGWHGLHLHQIGNCSDVGTFKLSGGHMGLIPDGHGLLNPIGPEAGDLTNIWAGSDGAAGYEVFSTWVKPDRLFDADGTALVIHAERDDHITQPIGGAGARVACAVIEKVS